MLSKPSCKLALVSQPEESSLWSVEKVTITERKENRVHVSEAWRGDNIGGCNASGCERGFRSETHSEPHPVMLSVNTPCALHFLCVCQVGERRSRFYQQKYAHIKREAVTCSVIKHLNHFMNNHHYYLIIITMISIIVIISIIKQCTSMLFCSSPIWLHDVITYPLINIFKYLLCKDGPYLFRQPI